jgi:ribosomal protein S18 acetylase RimI-like enzyme
MPQPHWYLWVIGVEPERQRHGVGKALLRPMLERAAAEGAPCYLETHKERNVAYYQAFGFELVTEGSVPKGGPRFWTMRREPTGR